MSDRDNVMKEVRDSVRHVDMFDAMLRKLVHGHGVDWLLNLPGVYEIASEELNNDVLEALERERNP